MSGAVQAEKQKFLSLVSTLSKKPPLTVAAADIDHFRSMNEAHDLEFGDKVLELVTRAFEANLPEEAAFARLGGDEFVAALPQTTPEEALILLDEVRQFLSERNHRIGKHTITIGMSIGLASLPQHTTDPTKLLGAADAALLRAKNEGRDRVAIYIEDKMVLKSNYYPKAQLAKLSLLSERLERTEASLLREGLAGVLDKYSEHL